LVFTGCPTDITTDDDPVIPGNPSTDTVDPAFWFIEIYEGLIERVGEVSSDDYTGLSGIDMGELATYQYVYNAINKKWGTDYTLPSSGMGTVFANCEFLLKKIDEANRNTTSYGTSGKATKQLVDKAAVDAAVNALWKPNDKFVAVAYESNNKAAYSTDGINWTLRTLPSSSYWNSVTYGNGKFVAIASSNSNKVIYSTDGINWTGAILPVIASWYDITYGDGKFVAVAPRNTKAVYSINGINWIETTMPSNAYWYAVTYGNGKFVTVVFDRTNKAAYSTDGINWIEMTMPSSADWAGVAYGDGKFVAIAFGSNTAAYSTDGIN
jgi:hypothetical protein